MLGVIDKFSHMYKDTKDFLQKLNQIEEIAEDDLIVPLDVKSLHTNIPNNKGIKTVKEAYDKHPNNFTKYQLITFMNELNKNKKQLNLNMNTHHIKSLF